MKYIRVHAQIGFGAPPQRCVAPSGLSLDSSCDIIALISALLPQLDWSCVTFSEGLHLSSPPLDAFHSALVSRLLNTAHRTEERLVWRALASGACSVALCGSGDGDDVAEVCEGSLILVAMALPQERETISLDNCEMQCGGNCLSALELGDAIRFVNVTSTTTTTPEDVEKDTVKLPSREEVSTCDLRDDRSPGETDKREVNGKYQFVRKMPQSSILAVSEVSLFDDTDMSEIHSALKKELGKSMDARSIFDKIRGVNDTVSFSDAVSFLLDCHGASVADDATIAHNLVIECCPRHYNGKHVSGFRTVSSKCPIINTPLRPVNASRPAEIRGHTWLRHSLELKSNAAAIQKENEDKEARRRPPPPTTLDFESFKRLCARVSQL